MEPESRRRVSDLYHAALARPPEERGTFLQSACAGDEALRQEVESLLQYEPASSRFLEAPAAGLAGVVAEPDGSSTMIGRHVGPYAILATLGAGGMGEVYRARDTKLGRDVAIKILPAAFTADAERRTRFAREARLLATLNHPHIGAIYGFEESDGVTALVLELVEGPTLAERLERGPMKEAEVLTIARQVAEALEAAHEKGIVHRDLKPANIVLQSGASSSAVRAKVLDFGLAKTMSGLGREGAQGASGSVNATEDGRILGTPAYMSPEQTRGQPVDRRTDIWAFGCVLYEMLSGRQAFVGDTMSDTFVSILEREPDWTALPAATPNSVRTLLQRCLRKEPERRLHDIADALIEINECDAATSATAGVSHVLRRRRAAIVVVATAVALLAAVGVAWMYWPVPPSVQQSPIARRLTFDPGLQTDPTFSPDGRWIAYASNKSGNFDIWMQPVDGGDAVQVTHDPAHDRQPDWSPKDNRIVFRSERDGGGLFVVPATGGREEKLTTLGYTPRWSPDGSRVLFVELALSGAGRGRVYTVRLDGTPPQPIDTRTLPEPLQNGGSVGWHLDSRRVSFLGAGGLSAPVQVASVDVNDGTTERFVISPDVQETNRDQRLGTRATEPHVWAPDATAIYFVGFSRGLNNIWSFDVDPRTLAITGGPHRISTMPQTNEAITVSRGGAGIAFGAAARTSRIVSYQLDAEGKRIVGTPETLTPPELFTNSPDFTRDGTRLLFRAFRPGSGTGRVELRILGDGPELIGPVDESLGPPAGRQESRQFPRWSPDGTQIVYRHIRQERQDQASEPVLVRSLVLFDVSTGKESPLTTPSSDSKYGTETAYGWSPDGRYVVSTGGRYKPGHRAIALVPISAAPKAEAQATIVTSSPEYGLWNSGMSPNGRWICFQAQTDAVSRLVVVDSKGGTWKWLTDERVWVDKPRWSTDGRLIYFVSREGGFFNVWAVEFDPDRGVATGEPFQVTRFDGSAEHILPDVGQVELAIGGRKLAIPVINPTGGIWMLERLRR